MNIKVYKLNRTFVAGNGYIPSHEHGYYEFHVIPKGRGTVTIEGHEVEVEAGQLYITGPNVRHLQISHSCDPLFEYCLSCSIDIVDTIPSQYAFSAKEINIILDTLSNVYPQAFKDVYNIRKRFEEIFAEAEEQVSGYYLKIQTLIADIIVDLFRTIASPDKMKFKYDLPKKAEEEILFQRLVEYVQVMHQKDFTLEEVAKNFSISTKHINKIIKAAMNMTFHDYLLEYRFKKAKHLLLTTGLSIEEIAFESGFSSHHYMYQVFRRFGEVPPARLREKSL